MMRSVAGIWIAGSRYQERFRRKIRNSEARWLVFLARGTELISQHKRKEFYPLKSYLTQPRSGSRNGAHQPTHKRAQDDISMDKAKSLLVASKKV
ncbi:hypothetical protein H6P81_017184 [Aristolochia fimbriata]|uniref:Uncharacterized protein n=1 Tax=Aristolochia fimbriata TaxID=158543 RepID=A0AAV7DXG0_ARIFI|nr:hypothetical protein H6P81_017184 [Aristolochia fimbriata]